MVGCLLLGLRPESPITKLTGLNTDAVGKAIYPLPLVKYTVSRYKLLSHLIIGGRGLGFRVTIATNTLPLIKQTERRIYESPTRFCIKNSCNE